MLSKLASGNEKGGLSSVVRQVLIKPTIECFNVVGSTRQKGWKDDIIQLIREQEEGGTLNAEATKKIA